MKPVNIGTATIGPDLPIVIFSGPCVIESARATLEIAARLKQVSAKLKVPFIFKSSYDKANRSSLEAFRGVGLAKGLEILAQVRESTGLPVISDVHCRSEIKPAAEVLDAIQIPAFLCRQTDLLLKAGETGLPVNVKKAQFLSPEEMKQVVHKVESTGNRKILVTERGTFFGYHNLVVDFRSIVTMRKLGYPVIFDATHSVQIPGEHGTSSGGRPEFIFPLARAASAVGVSGLYLEVHPRPDKALCDGANSLKLSEFSKLVSTVVRIDRLAKSLSGKKG